MAPAPVSAPERPDSEADGAAAARKFSVDHRLVAVLAFATVVRLAWCLYAARTPHTFGDPYSYLSHANDIANGLGYHGYPANLSTAYYPIGYPGLLGGLLWIARLVVPSTTAMQVAMAVNLVCGVATVGLVYDLGRRLIGRRVGLVAAVMVAIFPSLVLYAATAYTETVFTFLVVLIAWLLVGPWPTFSQPDVSRLIVFGVVLGATALVRPVILGFVPVLLVLWWVTGAGGWRSVRSIAIVVVAAIVVIAPWSIRSTIAMGGFVAISTNTGDDLCIGHSAQSTGHYQDLFDWCWKGYENLPPAEVELTRDHTGTRRAIHYALDHPGREATLLVKKAYYLFEHDHEGVQAEESYGQDLFLGSTFRSLIELVADVWYFAVVGFALAGAVMAVRARNRGLIVVLALMVTLLAVPLVFFGGSRLHVPALPLAALFAASAGEALWMRLRGKQNTEWGL